jgi:hypothetical protein
MKATQSPTPNGDGRATAITARPQRRAIHPPPEPTTLLQAIITAASNPAVDLQKVEHLIRLRKEMEQADAEQAFNAALAAAQAQMVPIVAETPNPHANGHKYATYAALDKVLRPIYSSAGLALTFTTGERSADSSVEVVAYLIGHGHSRRYTLLVPADGKGARGGDVMSKTHATASAISYGMRYLLCMVFNVAIIRDDDGNAASPRKSSAQLKREGVWEQFCVEMRAAKSHQALQSVVERWKPRVQQWSEKWRGAAEELHGQCHERLGGTIQALKDSAERLDHHSLERLREADAEHDRDRWLRNLEDTNRGRW